MGEWEALFANDPDNDYALIMEFWFGDEQIGVVRDGKEGLSVDLYGTGSEPVVIPLAWLIDRLVAAQESNSSPNKIHRSEIHYSGITVARIEGFVGDLVVYLYGSGRKAVLVSFEWLLGRLVVAREDLLKARAIDYS